MNSKTTTFKLKLNKTARRGGGDRYETEHIETHEPIAPFYIYLPQAISRIGRSPIQSFLLTVTPNKKGE